jgi:type IV pilus assembly protein PilM
MPPSLKLKLGRRSGGDVIGLDIQPGLAVAVQARVNGGLLAERVAAASLPADTLREGDVVDPAVLSESLQELFDGSRLGKRVRVGVANQRTVMRTLELPPLTDAKELAAAVRFSAQDQVPMPLANAVLDFHPLGIVDTPAGPRQRVVLVAAQRDMIERLLAAVRDAGLSPVGVDLSAFALIRSLYSADQDDDGRVLYVNVDGLTNVAIAEATVCRFTRVVGGGVEEMAVELAERRAIPLSEARALIAQVDLREFESVDHDAPMVVEEPVAPGPSYGARPDAAPQSERDLEIAASEPQAGDDADAEQVAEPAAADEREEPAGSAEEPDAEGPDVGDSAYAEELSSLSGASGLADAKAVLENGIRGISGEVRNSLDFHRTQEGGGDVERVVLSGFALDIPGFAQALERSLGVEVRPAHVGMADAVAGAVSANRLSIAAGLATTEAPR